MANSDLDGGYQLGHVYCAVCVCVLRETLNSNGSSFGNSHICYIEVELNLTLAPLLERRRRYLSEIARRVWDTGQTTSVHTAKHTHTHHRHMGTHGKKGACCWSWIWSCKEIQEVTWHHRRLGRPWGSEILRTKSYTIPFRTPDDLTSSHHSRIPTDSLSDPCQTATCRWSVVMRENCVCVFAG